MATATPTAALVSSGWFQDVAGTSQPLHAGAAAWSAASTELRATPSSNSNSTFDWIVQFQSTALSGINSAAQTASLLVGSGVEFEVLRGLGLVGQVLVRSQGVSAQRVESILASNRNVASFEADQVQQFQSAPNDPQVSLLWSLSNTGQNGGLAGADIDAQAAWNLTTGSSNVVIAVVDSGVDWQHPDLAANIWTNSREIAGNGIDDDHDGFVDDVHGYNFAGNSGNPMDDNGHGTHVAGTIAAVGNNGTGVTGVAWSSSIMPLKFLSDDGSGYTSDAVRAINYATMERTTYGVNVRVINMSWGGGAYSDALAQAIQSAGDAGILCVAAAGNNGRNNDVTASYPSSYSATNLLAVAATDNRDNLASFSNYGATSVDLAAPGVGIVSTYIGNRYVSLSGTSMATPQVSGVAALAWALDPNATVADVKNAILNGVDHVASLSGKVLSGGRLNAYHTLQLLTPKVALPPQIASLAVASGSVTAGASVSLTASGVTDPDGAVAGVWFYQDSNGDGQWDAGDRVLGNTATVVGQQASFTVNTTGYTSGSYRVFARAQDNSGQWSSAIAATFQVSAADDFGNNAATAAAVSVGTSVSGKIESGGDRDWLKFQAVAGRGYSFRTQLGTLADSVLTLYNQDGVKVLASNDDYSGLGLASRIDWTATASGTFYLEVKGFATSQTGTYTLASSTQNSAPTLAAIADQSMSVRQDAISVPLVATDSDGDRLTFSVQAIASSASNGSAYDLVQRLGLHATGNYLQNYLGLQEKWIRGDEQHGVLPAAERRVALLGRQQRVEPGGRRARRQLLDQSAYSAQCPTGHDDNPRRRGHSKFAGKRADDQSSRRALG